MSTTPVSVRTAKYHVLPDHNYLQCDIDVVLLFATDGVATDLTVLGMVSMWQKGGEGEQKLFAPKNYLPKKTICPKKLFAQKDDLPFIAYCIGWQPGQRWAPFSLSSRSRREHRADLACSPEPVITLSLSLQLFTSCTMFFCGHHQRQQRKTKSPELEFPPAVAVQEDCAARCDSPDIDDINIIVLKCWGSW